VNAYDVAAGARAGWLASPDADAGRDSLTDRRDDDVIDALAGAIGAPRTTWARATPGHSTMPAMIVEAAR
jgi:hypothetical protein